MGPRAGLDRCRKSRPPLGIDPQTIHPVASHYTDYTILAHYTQPYCLEIWMKISSKNGQHTPINEKYACYAQFMKMTSAFTAANTTGSKS